MPQIYMDFCFEDAELLKKIVANDILNYPSLTKSEREQYMQEIEAKARILTSISKALSYYTLEDE